MNPTCAVFLDIDKTINVAEPAPGMSIATRTVGYPLHATVEAVDWICELHNRGVWIIWNTTWNDQADDYAEWFGLPRGLPYIKHDENRTSFGHSLKVRGAVRFLEDNPHIVRAVVLDDMVGNLDGELDDVVAGRLLIPELHETHGITHSVIEQADAFMFA